MARLTTILRNAKGRQIGSLIPGSGGKIVLIDVNGKQIGYYNPRNDSTYWKDGRLVGQGNILAALLNVKP